MSFSVEQRSLKYHEYRCFQDEEICTDAVEEVRDSAWLRSRAFTRWESAERTRVDTCSCSP